MPVKSSDRLRIFLNKVHLKGFKSIEDLSINFQKGLNILIGKNGSGKSNFLEFLYEGISFKRYHDLPYAYSKIEYISNDGHSFILELKKDLNVRTDKDYSTDRVEIIEKLTVDHVEVYDSCREESFGKFTFKNHNVAYRGNIINLFFNCGYQNMFPVFIKFSLPDNLDFIETSGILGASNVGPIVNWAYPKTLRFIDDIFWDIETTFSRTNDIEIDVSKKNVIEHLKIGAEIIENLKLCTTIENVRFNPNINLYAVDKVIPGEKTITIENIKIEFNINGQWLPWSQLSDGTKRLFYIIAEVTNAEGLVLIEEPELGVHPHQFNLLMDFLKEQSEHKQIIISTHSPKALDHLSQDELNSILITYYDLKKGTQIRHLTAKEITKAKKYMKEVGFFSDYWLLSDLEE